jgi:hypothetical protein
MLLLMTRPLLSDGEYDHAAPGDTFVVIGDSGAGDVYLLDTAFSSPVYSPGHATHRIEPERPASAAYVEEWVRIAQSMTGSLGRRRMLCRAVPAKALKMRRQWP